MRTRAPKRTCVLCRVALTSSPYDGIWLHPDVTTCRVRVTDNLGISADDAYVIEGGQLYASEATAATATEPVAVGGAVFTTDGVVMFDQTSAWFSADVGAKRLFDQIEQPYLGGSSGLRGWSSISTYQKCPHLWKLKYGGGSRTLARGDEPGPQALEIGSLVHLFLAIHYSQRINPLYPCDPEQAKRFLELVPVTPAYLEEAWRLFDGHRAYYGDESWMKPLAVEEQVVDPRTGFSCRWDLVFEVPEPYETLLPGVYVCNHKTGSANTLVGREEWRNDGQIFGEIDLYDQLGYHRRWGALRGAYINRIIKTKTPQYQRIFVQPSKGVLKEHRKSLAVWTAQMEVAAATGNYPRARAACVTRYQGLCEQFDNCAGSTGDEPREIEA